MFLMFSPPPNSAPSVRPPNTLQRKKRPQERRSSMSPLDTEMLSALKSLQQQQLQKQQRVPLDDDEQFLLSLLPVLRSLDPISKFELRGELNDTALRYLRRKQQTVPHHSGQGYFSGTSTPNYQPSPSTSNYKPSPSPSVAETYQYSQYNYSQFTDHQESTGDIFTSKCKLN
ncbi:hypothetical protein RRG08_015154 [Elysia crispata]|uniref:BESS domain-containing protein n=1 Tax=Elysia crispata TaxID=231223 RepID=A0AAE1AZQ1_9GAST|nr:hypothetical protein RRG08_015154 [Elysia crispata]